MYFSTTAIVSAIFGLVAAQGGMLKMHVVQVGGPNGSLAFYPNNVAAQPGDMVQFQFHPKVCLVAVSAPGCVLELIVLIEPFRRPIHIRQPLHTHSKHHA